MEPLERKSSTMPHQLENYTIKKFKDGTAMETQAKKTSKVDRDQEIARLRNELALLKMEKGEAVIGAKGVKQVEVSERRTSLDQKPKVRRAERGYAGGEGLDRRQSVDQSAYDDDSQTAVITVDQGKRRRSSANTPTGRSSMDSIEQRREPRYHSPRTSKDLGRRELYVVQVTEALPKPKSVSKQVTTFREVTVYQKEARHSPAR